MAPPKRSTAAPAPAKKSSLTAPKTTAAPASKKRARVVEPQEQETEQVAVEAVTEIKATKEKKGKKVVPEADEIVFEAQGDDEEGEQEEAEIDFLKGFESEDGEDSSDEEDNAVADARIDPEEGGSTGKSFSIASLPKVGADTAAKIVEQKKKVGRFFLFKIIL